MSNDSYARTPVGFFEQIGRRLTSLERRLANQPMIPDPIPVQGTTAQRDARFGPEPTTDADRVNLANQKPIWYNTDLGWEESYYAVTGLSGLTARGLVAGTASGWYPTGPGGPRISFWPTSSNASPGSGNVITGWSGVEWYNGASANWITYLSGVFTIVKAGRYRIKWSTGVNGSIGQVDIHFRLGATFRNIAVSTPTTYANQLFGEYSDVPCAAGETTRVELYSAGTTVHVTSGGGTAAARGEFVIEYLGPNLVTS